MNPLTFTCSNCQNSIAVAPEFAGMAVSCPHCKKVVMAPPKVAAAAPKDASAIDSNIHAGWAAVERSTANLRASQKQAKEREDSIFSDPEEDGDDEALFGLDPVKKTVSVEMPIAAPTAAPNRPQDLTQPTQRVPGLGAAPAIPRSQTPTLPVRKLPVSVPDSKSFAGSLNLYPPSARDAADDANPFVMEAAIQSEFAASEIESEVAEPAVARRKKEPVTEAAPNWKLWIIIGLSVYSFMMTVVAIWGWMRSPQVVAPVKSDTPATQKAKTR
jgi:hypothetical protein